MSVYINARLRHHGHFIGNLNLTITLGYDMISLTKWDVNTGKTKTVEYLSENEPPAPVVRPLDSDVDNIYGAVTTLKDEVSGETVSQSPSTITEAHEATYSFYDPPPVIFNWL